MRLLVTGGAGFIGRFVVERLSSRAEVVVLDDFSSANAEAPLHAARVVEASIVDHNAVSDAMAEVDGVVHLAGVSSVTECKRHPGRTREINVNGALCVAEESAKRRLPFVFASSAAVYGSSCGPGPLFEDSSIAPCNEYGCQKAEVERELRAAGMDHVALRLFNVYGSGQNVDSHSSGVISRLMNSIQNGAPFKLHGDGSQSRDFVYAGDVAAAVDAALGLEGMSVINIGSGKSVSLLELIRRAESATGRRANVTWVDNDGGVMESLASLLAAKRLLNWEPETSLDVGLRTFAGGGEALRSLVDLYGT